METFADYILGEKDFSKKVSIIMYLQKRENIFFDNSCVFKATLAKLFIDTMEINVDKNMVITACLLMGCKKVNVASDLNKIKNYAKNTADYLNTLGFSERFCKICEEQNRYSNSVNRESESDILELVDQFGGMLLNRPERRGLPVDEAIVLLQHRNLKNYNNIYMKKFLEFVSIVEGVSA